MKYANKVLRYGQDELQLLAFFGFERSGLAVQGAAQLPLQDAQLAPLALQQQTRHLINAQMNKFA